MTPLCLLVQRRRIRAKGLSGSGSFVRTQPYVVIRDHRARDLPPLIPVSVSCAGSGMAPMTMSLAAWSGWTNAQSRAASAAPASGNRIR